MPYTVAYNPADQIVEASLEGKTDLIELRDLVYAIVQTASQAQSFLVLTDLRAAQLDITLTRVYYLPKMVHEAITDSGFNVYAFKRAFVIAPHMTYFRFYETVARNRGHHTVLFLDIEEAKEWLLEN